MATWNKGRITLSLIAKLTHLSLSLAHSTCGTNARYCPLVPSISSHLCVLWLSCHLITVHLLAANLLTAYLVPSNLVPSNLVTTNLVPSNLVSTDLMLLLLHLILLFIFIHNQLLISLVFPAMDMWHIHGHCTLPMHIDWVHTISYFSRTKTLEQLV